MGTTTSASEFKSEYDRLKNTTVTRLNKSFTEEKVNIEEHILNHETYTKKRHAKTLNFKSRGSAMRKSVSCERNGTIYRIEDASVPINVFFNKLFKKSKKNRTKVTIEDKLNNSDLNFSDLESLKITTDDDNENNSLALTFKLKQFCEDIEPLEEKKPGISYIPNELPDSLENNYEKEISQSLKKEIEELNEDNEDLPETGPSSKSITPKIGTGLPKIDVFFPNKCAQDIDFNESLNNNSTSNKMSNLIRSSYLTKLAIKNVLPTKKHESIEKNALFIFDWDDTLFLTTHLAPLGIFRTNPRLTSKEWTYLKQFEDLIFDILSFTIKNGNTYIITNAMKGWVEHCCSKFYPKVYKLLRHVVVISARTEFEEFYPANDKEWKIRTFCNIANHYNQKALTNIICFGDNAIEIEASQLLSTRFENCYLKSIKFRPKPRPEELMKELKLVKEKINDIYSYVRSLTINVEKKPKNKNSTDSTVPEDKDG